MFKFTDLRRIHLEVTNNCQASCPMCNRNINGGLENPLIKTRSWTLDNFKKIMNEEVLNQIQDYYYCGNFGDPLLNNDLIDMCEYSKEVNPSLGITIHTNGSLRSKEWWIKLASALPKNHQVVFGIDGLEDTHSLYRIGTKFNTIIENATAFIKAGGRASWVYIKFKHNEHQVDKARQLSESLGFEKFILKNSSRFVLEPYVKVVDRYNRLSHYIEPSSDTPLKFIDKDTIRSYKDIVQNSDIKCQVLESKEIYIDAYMDFFPCCWLAHVPYTYITSDEAAEVRKEMRSQYEEMTSILGNINVLERSIKDIVNSDEYQTIWNKYWNSNKLITCVRTCGVSKKINFSQSPDQFEKIIDFNKAQE